MEFIDRRGGRKIEEAPKVEPQTTPVVTARNEDRRSWKPKSLAFILQILPVDGQPLVAGVAAALRADGNPFTANYLLEQEWAEGFRWEDKAKKRLNTFLGCECDSHNPCNRHMLLISEWLQEDRERLAKAAVRPIPEVMEILFRAQQARQAAQKNILVPRG